MNQVWLQPTMHWSPSTKHKTISYTFGMHHRLSAPFDIILDRFIVDLSLDLMSNRKAFQVRCNPSLQIFRNLMSSETYHLTNVNSVYKFTKLENNHVHYVDFDSGTCSCPSFLKHGYCKHIIYLHKKKYVNSKTIIIDHRFKCRGNTRMTQAKRKIARCSTCFGEKLSKHEVHL